MMGSGMPTYSGVLSNGAYTQIDISKFTGSGFTAEQKNLLLDERTVRGHEDAQPGRAPLEEVVQHRRGDKRFARTCRQSNQRVVAQGRAHDRALVAPVVVPLRVREDSHTRMRQVTTRCHRRACVRACVRRKSGSAKKTSAGQ